MKKVFIMLGIIILSIMMSSCKELKKDIEGEKQPGSEEILEEVKKEYKLSKYSDEINKVFLEWEYLATSYPDESILYMNMIKYYSYYDEIIISDYSNDLKDYYTCGYLDKKIKDKLNDIDYYIIYNVDKIKSSSISLVGKDFALVKYNNMINFTEKITFDEYPLVWYEIPKGEEIPEEIEDMFLVCVLESKTVTYRRLDGTIKDESEFFIEKQSLYSKENNEYEYMNSWIEEMLFAKDKYMFFEDKNITKVNVQLPFTKAYTSPIYMKIKDIEGTEYVNGGDNTICEGVDLSKQYEYVLEEKNYLFKLEDIIKTLEGSKKWKKQVYR